MPGLHSGKIEKQKAIRLAIQNSQESLNALGKNLRSNGFEKSDPFSLEGILKESVLLLKTADSVSSYADFSEANTVMK